MKLDARCKQIELILADVDGVLTDGGVVYDNQGIEIKKFFIRDGLGIKLWQRAGFQFGIVTARNSHIVKVRAAELGVELLRQGFEEKLRVVQEISEQLETEFDKICFIGDDLPDLATIRMMGLGVAVADAVPEVRAAAHYTTKASGGSGAVREVTELILKAQGRWDDIVRRYES